MRMKKGARPSHMHQFPIELHRAMGFISIAETLQEAINRLPDEFNKQQDAAEDAAGLFLSDGTGGFATCYTYEEIGYNVLVHELFHMTHDILERSGANFDSDHDEQGALLIGWLMEKTVTKLREWKVRL